METQLAFFPMEKNDESTGWSGLPKKTRQEIEVLFASILIRHLSLSVKEDQHDEK